MKVIENVTLYECDHCQRKMRRAGDMTRHEKNCKENPLNIDACLGCIYIKEEKVTYESLNADEWGSTYEVESKAFRCTKLDKLMYPFKAEKHAKKYPNSFENQVRMPIECGHFNMWGTNF